MTDAELAAARLAALLDAERENTALRAKMDRIMLEAERHRRIADEAIDRQDAQLLTERAAVVAWLREEYDTDSARSAADEIERGEHRREETP